ncbi:hypothetical protein BGZ63DRAFT_422698 [Mariannaea sp. PMI_226]|nr:hypothetical protein BGZ63DRAFT_422698 [Mariannaea sp. PMI_226]
MPAIPPPPSETVPPVTTSVLLTARQQSTTFVSIPASYGDLYSSPSPGVIAGIVIGSVAGFLLLLYIIYCILHGALVMIPLRAPRKTADGAPPSTLGTSTLGPSTYGTRTALSIRSHRGRDKRRAPSSRHSRSPRTETAEVRRTTSTRTHHQQQQRRGGVEPVIVSPPRSPSPVSTVAPPRFVPASEVSALSDEIVVEEEHSPPRRHASRRYSPERGYRRDSYYREDMDSERYYSQRDSPGRRTSRRY